MSESLMSKAMREREERMVGYIKDKLSCAEIAAREGIQSDYACKERRKVAKKHGLTLERGSSNTTLSLESQKFRKMLASRLNDLDVLQKVQPRTITREIGIPVKHQKVANGVLNTDPPYDWTLSQLERFAKFRGISLAELLVDALRTDLIAKAGKRKVGDLVNDWVYGEQKK